MIEFVAPLPPPLHGFSLINSQFLELLKHDSNVKVRRNFFQGDRKKLSAKVLFIFHFLKDWFAFLFSSIFKRPKSIYVGCSGGLGILIDICYIVVGKILFIPVFVHHHSFSYINYHAWYYRLSFLIISRCNNIVLCDFMAQKLLKIYGVEKRRIVVLSNVAFLGDSAQRNSSGNDFFVGYLSNITREKGAFDFIRMAQLAEKNGLNFNFLVAGPIDASIKVEFLERVSQLTNVTYIGGVYGENKKKFFESIKILIFPTRYLNEAEPVTILEALQHGLPVIANYRGCIGSIIDDQCSYLVSDPEIFPEMAIDFLNKISDGVIDYASYSSASFRKFHTLRSTAVQARLKIVNSILCGKSFG